MINVDAYPEAKVLIVIPSGGLTRYIRSEMSIEALKVPKRSNFYRTISGSPARGRNEAVRFSDADTTHLFFMDDDHWFEPSILLQLLARKVPIVCGLTCMKYPPFTPMAFSREDIDAENHKTLTCYSWDDLDGRGGLIPVFAAAGAGLLVERRVFERLPDPWFRVGLQNPEDLSEDMYFYESARNAGFPIYVDLEAVFGHTAPVTVWPTREKNGVWTFPCVWENGDRLRIGRSDKPRASDTESKETA